MADRFSNKSLPVVPLWIIFDVVTKLISSNVVGTCSSEVSRADHFFSSFLDNGEVVVYDIICSAAFRHFS